VAPADGVGVADVSLAPGFDRGLHARAAAEASSRRETARLGVPSTARHRYRQAGPPWKTAVAGIAACGAAAYLLAVHWGGHVRQTRPLIEEVDRLAEAAGFGISHVFLEGHRMTLDSDIFDALGLSQSRSLLRFDSATARARIERLPWIKTAAISRIFPDTISIAVSEREPFAVWNMPGGGKLIDITGRVLGGAAAGSWQDLPRIAGAGAPERAAQLFSEMRRHEDLLGRVETAVLVGQRRWTLQLRNGTEVKLPAFREGEALSSYLDAIGKDGLLDRGYAVVDLRHPGRLLLRPRSPDASGMGGRSVPSG
jgi:cell division protein FtsQ